MDTKKDNSKSAINTLPELPLEAFELGGKLEHHEVEPILSIIPLRLPLPKKPHVTVARAGRCLVTVKQYVTQVLYPKVVCYPPNELFEPAIAQALRQPQKNLTPHESDLKLISKHNRFYKLSTFKGASLATPFYCTVKYGPWSAIVEEHPDCDVAGPSKWILTVNAIPGLEISWYGTWLDQPPYPLLHVVKGDLGFVGEYTDCCGDCKWCFATNTCIPRRIPCEGDTHL